MDSDWLCIWLGVRSASQKLKPDVRDEIRLPGSLLGLIFPLPYTGMKWLPRNWVLFGTQSVENLAMLETEPPKDGTAHVSLHWHFLLLSFLSVPTLFVTFCSTSLAALGMRRIYHNFQLPTTSPLSTSYFSWGACGFRELHGDMGLGIRDGAKVEMGMEMEMGVGMGGQAKATLTMMMPLIPMCSFCVLAGTTSRLMARKRALGQPATELCLLCALGRLWLGNVHRFTVWLNI